MGGRQGGQGQQLQGYHLQEVQTPQERAAIESITRAIEVCEFCADQCIDLGDPRMANCIRLCNDVSELGQVAQVLLTRKSQFSQPVVQNLVQAMRACAQECSQHRHAHCQDCASVLGQAMQSVQQAAGGRQTGGAVGGQTQGGPTGTATSQQPMGGQQIGTTL
jgi:primosomal replication protein N